MISIAVLMTCFNRIECTLRCLTALTNASNIENVNIDVYIVKRICKDINLWGNKIELELINIRINISF